MTKSFKFRPAILLAALLCPFPAVADPPFRDVLIEVPLDLTDLPNIISKLAVECEVTIGGVVPTTNGRDLVRTGRAEVNVVGGAVTQTLQVLVTVPSITKPQPGSAINSRSTSYVCDLYAFAEEGLGWHELTTRQVTGVARPRSGGFVSITPPPAEILGNINWNAAP